MTYKFQVHQKSPPLRVSKARGVRPTMLSSFQVVWKVLTS
uniref:Uncharacterized protein n=1 Tax=Arundo donax TaxID=35708 RepID=A0A0A8Z708_ARUDO